MKTKVIFLYSENPIGNPQADLFAFFPEIDHNSQYKTSYSHIGQHSACAVEYAQEARQADLSEYKELKTELENIGYDLEVCSKSEHFV